MELLPKMRVIWFMICWSLLLCRVSCDSSQCGCQLQPRSFDTKYRDIVYDTCKKCFSFEYNYYVEQNWTARICVRSLKPAHTPLLVSARQSVSSISFKVPMTIKGESSDYSIVCRTLCPISNHGGNITFMNSTQQKIVLDFWSKSTTEFEYEVQILQNFIIGTNTPITLNLTVSEPAVLQYNVPGHLNSVRIQANSDTSECMILSVEDIECPFHDTHESVQQGGYRQTHTKKSSIMVKRDSFRGDLYIVLLLNPHDKDCVLTSEDTSEGIRFKEVTVEVTPVYGLSSVAYEVWVPALVIVIFGIFSGIWYHLCCADEAIILQLPQHTQDGQEESKEIFLEYNEAQYSGVFYMMSDMVEKKPWSSKSYQYCWNLGAVSIFYALPAIQLVYLSHSFMYKTGNLDECYYNFLCAHPVEIASWLVISDSNHVWSNIGYIILGITFIGIVWIRECKDPDSPRNVRTKLQELAERGEEEEEEKEQKGVPCHYGMFYALGTSLFMEGIMSAIYHICPKSTNFQFDTTFMYVICTLCIMKLFYGRHQAISPKSHSFWMMLAISVVLPFLGIFSEALFWFLYFVWCCIILFVTVCYVVLPRKLEFAACKNAYCSYLSRLRIPRLKGKKHYVGWCCRLTFVILGWIVIITATIVLKVVLHQDNNSILLFFFIVNVAWYTLFYIAMKIKQGLLVDRHKMFREKISYHSVASAILGLLLMGIAYIEFFLENNVEWSFTPALSRERNQKCYSDFDYYDKHDVWHFLSSFGLFFHFMFLLTVDNDLKNKPTSQIAVF